MDPLPNQQRAIEAPPGPVLVVAGPGAGKTYCLTERIRYLIDHGFSPQRICALTFTNRAAEEIESRLEHDVWRGTIHAFCLALLREFPERAGLTKGFGVADEQYQDVILHRLGVSAERRGGMLSRFGRHRFQQYRLQPDEARLYREYVAWLAHRNMVDFDELIVRAEPLAGLVAERWDYVLVDEFQDVNAVQYDLLKRLVAPHGNFFAVGDDEQSIFAWTGADPYVLERFRRDYDIAQPIVLDRNCRCSRQIFETARRVLAQNPQLFQKQLTADRESPHAVTAHAFPDERDEATWLIADLGQARDAAILYRKHRVGEYLEGRLLRAGIACRLARGRSLIEDAVIGYVVAALRVVRSPDDPAASHAFAQVVLSQHFLQEVEAALDPDRPFLASLRDLAARRPREHPDTKKLWRLIYQLENLRALPRAHRSLPPVIDEILSQTVGPYRNKLEERHDELTDPADWPEPAALAWPAPPAGVLVAQRGMLAAAGMQPDAFPLGCDTLTLFKALQRRAARDMDTTLPRYVTFDFETTDNDAATCGVIEIGAARVMHGDIVERFHAMINPYRPIAPKATAVHGYTDADVASAPPFSEVFPQFRAFVGDDVLIAHNGMNFDVPVLRRLAAGLDGVASLTFYDTYLLVRSLSHDSPKQEDIAHRLGIDCGRAHHALDDAVTLAHIYRALEQQRAARARKAVLANLLDYVALALALEHGATQPTPEHQLLFNVGRFRALGPYSDALELYAAGRPGDAPTLDQVIERLGGAKLMARLRAQRDPAQRYAAAVARLSALLAESAGSLEQDIDALIERVALSASHGVELADDRVNLLTLHSTKGLEFSRVYIVGVEDYEIPGFQAVTNNIADEIAEARRLLYVGMTRAREQLVLTRVARRFGREAGGSSLLDEMGLRALDLRDRQLRPALL